MKKISFILVFAVCICSCDKFKNYSEQVPKCNDSISIRLTTDLIRQTIAATSMAEDSQQYVRDCYQMIDEYKSGKVYDDNTQKQIEYAMANADSVDIEIKDVLPSNIDEKLKKCDCEASLIIKDHKIPITYSTQNTDEGTYVTIKNY